MGISDFINKQKQAYRERESAKFERRTEALKTLQAENQAREQKLEFIRAENKAKEQRKNQRKELVKNRLGVLNNISNIKKNKGGSNALFNFGQDSSNNPFRQGQSVNREVWGLGGGSSAWTGEKSKTPKKKKSRGKSITIRY